VAAIRRLLGQELNWPRRGNWLAQWRNPGCRSGVFAAPDWFLLPSQGGLPLKVISFYIQRFMAILWCLYRIFRQSIAASELLSNLPGLDR
jgi:hypothetical protein